MNLPSLLCKISSFHVFDGSGVRLRRSAMNDVEREMAGVEHVMKLRVFQFWAGKGNFWDGGKMLTPINVKRLR